MGKIIGLFLILTLVVGVGGAVWLVTAPIAPPTETVTQAIPDARIPH